MTKAKAAANSRRTAKPKAKPRGKPWPKGVSGNPAGRPKDGESLTAILSQAVNMYPEEVAAIVGKTNALGQAFLQMPPKVQAKWLMAFRLIAAFMFEPNSALFNAITERLDGKVPQPIVGGAEGDAPIKIAFDYGRFINSATRPVPDRDASGEDQGNLHGSSVGQDSDVRRTGTGNE